MFLTFYDRNFEAISDNSSLNIESFKLIRRAYDLNEFSGTCEPISLNIEPMFATMKQNDGTHYYDLLRPIITKDKQNKGSIVARDLFGVFNTECVIDFSRFAGSTLREYLQFIFKSWQEWDKSGFEKVTLNLDQITTNEELFRPTEKAVYNIKDLLSKALSFYNLYIDSYINMRTKTLEFTMKPNNANTVNIRLEDFGIEDFAKYEPAVNTAIVFAERNNGIIRHDWFLLRSGEITTNSFLRDIYPTSSKIFDVDGEEKTDEEFSQLINESDFEAVTELAENRYQESIPIESSRDPDRLNNIYFDTNFRIYYQNKEYRTLPLGEIEENGTINKILRIGFKPIDFIQVV